MKYRVCNVPGCGEVVANNNGKCAHHRMKARKAADKRTGRIRGSRWTALRRQVLRDQPFCHDGRSCAHKATSVEVDHITPLSLGGHPTSRDNLQGICRACHEQKTREEQDVYRRTQDD